MKEIGGKIATQVAMRWREVFKFYAGCLYNGSEKKSLDSESHESNHSKTAVNNFLFLAPELLFRGHVLKHASVNSEVTGFAFSVVHVEGGQFSSGNAQENLNIDSPANSGRSSEDVLVGVGFTWEVDAGLLDDASNNSQHAHASVLEFGPSGVLQVSLDIRTIKRKRRNEVRTTNQTEACSNHASWIVVQLTDAWGRIPYHRA